MIQHTTLLAGRLSFASAIAIAVALGATSAGAQTIKPYFETKKPRMIALDGDLSLDTNGKAATVYSKGSVSIAFEGISQYDGAAFGRNFIPPDTMGAVGKTQFMEFSNGAVAVFDKATGTRTSLVSDVAWWGAAGQIGSSGDQRVLYNAEADRWIAVGFGGNTKDLQIAVSNTSDALGGWQSTKFEGYAGFGFGAVADYPTLALDKNAVYIGTNNFAPATAGGSNSFRGTTLDVIPLASLFGAGAPTTTGLQKFETPYPGTFEDRGFAIQGVNSNSNSTTGTVVAASLFSFDNMSYDITNAGSGAASLTPIQYLGVEAFDSPTPAHQPAVANPANQAVIDSLDERISSSAWEVDGRIYFLHTVNEEGGTNNVVRYYVIDAVTKAILDQGNISEAGYDFFQGSMAVNEFGQVVIAYNRSGLNPADGSISFRARTFYTDEFGKLIEVGDELILKNSLVDDYHNGSLYGQNAAGRQRWGDYSAVTVDPEDPSKFWAIGQFAREYNLAQFGHPGGTGGSRWGTWIAAIDFDRSTGTVPEPGTWAIMILGLGLAGATLRRRRALTAAVVRNMV